jgi:CRISPR/Cas system-associated protein Csm6
LPSDAALALVVAEDSLWHAQSTTGPRSTLLARAAAMAAADVVKSAAVSDRDRLRANQIRETSQILLTVRLIEEASEALADASKVVEPNRLGFARLAIERASEALDYSDDLEPKVIAVARRIIVRAMTSSA